MKATLRHGYGTLFSQPPELEIVKTNWADLIVELAKIDLDVYQGYDAILSFAPKSRLNVRRVGLLHTYDFIFYTVLVLALKTAVGHETAQFDQP